MARVGGLEVYAMKNGEPELLPSNSERYLIVEGIVHLALSLIENPAGRNSLVQVATTIVNHRNNPPGKKRKPVPHAYKYSLGEMPHWIDKFDWEHNMTDWNPKSAAYMYVSDMIIHNMAHIRRQPPNIARDNYNKFKFQMVIAVVHEITHILTGYITGQAEPLTPPTVTLELYGDTRKGEAGRHWEGMLLGGVVEFYQDSKDPLGPRQAGIPWLIQDGRNNVVARMISMDYINNFLNGDFSFPIGTSNAVPATDRSGLRKASIEMAFVRDKTRRKMPPYTPLEGTASGSVSYRRLPEDPTYTPPDYAPQNTYGSTQYGNIQYANNPYRDSQYGSSQGASIWYGNSQYGRSQYGNDQYGTSQAGPSNSNASNSGHGYGGYDAGGYGYRR
ncbi:hypothetical protein F4806DRAFT_499820 [Annulohypoxylon nitens]|nr:hypothetical protein F4806DRAFT_499820 [Annulohypoxylon nitens]